MKIKNSKALNLKKYWNTPPKGRFLSVKEIGALGLYTLGTNSFYYLMLYFLVTIIFIPYFYKIESIHAYIILICGNTLNMLLQPIIGNAMEKTKTKIGKYKPYILGMLPFLVVCTVLATFIPQGFGKTERIIYAYCTCTPTILLVTFANNMYQTMPTVVTTNSQERSDIMTPLGIIAGLASSILTLIIGPIRSAFSGREYMSMRLLGIITAVFGALSMLFILRVKERTIEVQIPNEEAKLSMKDALKMLSKNAPLVIMSIALCLGSLREFWKFFIQFFGQTRFNSDVNIALDVMGIPTTLMGLGTTFAMLALPLLTRKFSKNIVVIIFAAINLVACSIIAIIGFQNISIGIVSIVVITILFLAASAVGAVIVILPTIIGDIADYQQAKTGKRLEGHIQNFLLTIPLLFSQIIMLALSFIQTKIGFEPMNYAIDTMKKNANGNYVPYSNIQQLTACNWFNIVCIVSAVSSALMIIVLIFYPLSKKKHAKIMQNLADESVKALPKDTTQENEKEAIDKDTLDLNL